MTAESEWLDAQSDESLLCRDTRIHHSWRPMTATRVATGFREELKCDRCGVVKVSMLSRQGYILATRTDYAAAPGYLRKGIGRMTRDDNARVRLAVFKRRWSEDA